MSISFWIAKAPKTRNYYECMCRRDGKTYPDCHECKGTGVVSFENSTAEFDMSNSNSHLLFQALDVPFDYAGSFPLEDMWKLHDRALEKIREAHDNNDEYMVQRLSQFRDLTLAALFHQDEICWG